MGSKSVDGRMSLLSPRVGIRGIRAVDAIEGHVPPSARDGVWEPDHPIGSLCSPAVSIISAPRRLCASGCLDFTFLSDGFDR